MTVALTFLLPRIFPPPAVLVPEAGPVENAEG